MRTQTASEKAEAHVALIRKEYPNPITSDEASTIDCFRHTYCVALAADHFDNSSVPDPFRKTIVGLNNAGRFEEAWAALTDYYTEKFSA